jgi:hypothetical protein
MRGWNWHIIHLPKYKLTPPPAAATGKYVCTKNVILCVSFSFGMTKHKLTSDGSWTSVISACLFLSCEQHVMCRYWQVLQRCRRVVSPSCDFCDSQQYWLEWLKWALSCESFPDAHGFQMVTLSVWNVFTWTDGGHCLYFKLHALWTLKVL